MYSVKLLAIVFVGIGLPVLVAFVVFYELVYLEILSSSFTYQACIAVLFILYPYIGELCIIYKFDYNIVKHLDLSF